LLADLCKLEEETAAAAAVGDTKPPAITGNEEQQMSGEEFASFMQSLQQSKNIIHDPISLAIYDTVKLGNQPSQSLLKSEETTAKTQKEKATRPPPIQHSGHLDVHRPPSVSTPLSPSHVSAHYVLACYLGAFTLELSVLYDNLCTLQCVSVEMYPHNIYATFQQLEVPLYGAVSSV